MNIVTGQAHGVLMLEGSWPLLDMTSFSTSRLHMIDGIFEASRIVYPLLVKGTGVIIR